MLKASASGKHSMNRSAAAKLVLDRAMDDAYLFEVLERAYEPEPSQAARRECARIL